MLCYILYVKLEWILYTGSITIYRKDNISSQPQQLRKLICIWIGKNFLNTVFGISKNRRGKTLLLIAKSLYLDTAVYFYISFSLFNRRTLHFTITFLFINRLIYLLPFNDFQLETYILNFSTSFHCPTFYVFNIFKKRIYQWWKVFHALQ